MSNLAIFRFTGNTRTYSQCYYSLIEKGKIEEADKVSSSVLIMIKDFEDSMQCLGFCYTPKFWFYRNFYTGPPKQNCLSAMRK